MNWKLLKSRNAASLDRAAEPFAKLWRKSLRETLGYDAKHWNARKIGYHTANGFTSSMPMTTLRKMPKTDRIIRFSCNGNIKPARNPCLTFEIGSRSELNSIYYFSFRNYPRPGISWMLGGTGNWLKILYIRDCSEKQRRY